MKAQASAICRKCGVAFVYRVFKSQRPRRFCSVSCSVEYNVTNLRNPDKICETCGRSFRRYNSNTGRDAGRCCSRECGWALSRKRTKVGNVYLGAKCTVTFSACQLCGKARSSRGPIAGKFCDHICRHAATYQSQKGLQSKPLQATCQECGVVFNKSHSRGGLFCSGMCCKRDARRAQKAKRRGRTVGTTGGRSDVAHFHKAWELTGGGDATSVNRSASFRSRLRTHCVPP